MIEFTEIEEDIQTELSSNEIISEIEIAAESGDGRSVAAKIPPTPTPTGHQLQTHAHVSISSSCKSQRIENETEKGSLQLDLKIIDDFICSHLALIVDNVRAKVKATQDISHHSHPYTNRTTPSVLKERESTRRN